MHAYIYIYIYIYISESKHTPAHKLVNRSSEHELIDRQVL